MRRIAVSLMVITAGPAFGQAPPDLMACVRIVNDGDRLACFDRAMAKASPETSAASETRAAEAAAVTAAAATAAKARADAEAATKRDAFGAETVATRDTRAAPPPAELQGLEAHIAEMLTNTSGLGVFLLDNGQLWKQVDTTSLPNVRVGDAVTLTRTGFGGYHLNFVRQKTWVLVKRLK